MGDKNTKTFADLFSNAVSDLDSENGEKKEKNVTFDNLFNLTSKNEDGSLDHSLNSNKEENKVFSSNEDKASDNNPFFNLSGDTNHDEDKRVESNVRFFDMNSTSVDDSLDHSNLKREELSQNFIQNDSDKFNAKVEDDGGEKKLSEDSIKDVIPSTQATQEISPFFSSDFNENENGMLGKINLVENISSNRQAQKLDLSDIKHYNVKVVKKKEPLFKFILGVISYAIFIWLLLIGVALLVYVLDIKIRASKGDYSSPTFNAYVVLTGSMLPEIQVYDVVVTKKVDPASLKVGDVITFASADTRFLNTIITHRIIRKEYDSKDKTYSFQTQGDNNNVADSALVPQNNIYGKVILKIPKLGYLQEFLASDGGWIIVILIPCLTVISYDVVKLIKGLKKKKYKGVTVQK